MKDGDVLRNALMHAIHKNLGPVILKVWIDSSQLLNPFGQGGEFMCHLSIFDSWNKETYRLYSWKIDVKATDEIFWREWQIFQAERKGFQ